MINQGFDPAEIAQLRAEAQAAGRNYVLNTDEPNTEEFVHFLFIGQHQGKPCIFDAVMFTLKLAHSSKLYEIAEEEAKREYPHYQPWELDADDKGNLSMPEEFDPEIEEFKADLIAALEETGEIKVKEELNIDTTFDYGVGLEVCLNLPEITEEDISTFIDRFNSGKLSLDPGLYSFVHAEDDEEEDEESDEDQ